DLRRLKGGQIPADALRPFEKAARRATREALRQPVGGDARPRVARVVRLVRLVIADREAAATREREPAAPEIDVARRLLFALRISRAHRHVAIAVMLEDSEPALVVDRDHDLRRRHSENEVNGNEL